MNGGLVAALLATFCFGAAVALAVVVLIQDEGARDD